MLPRRRLRPRHRDPIHRQTQCNFERALPFARMAAAVDDVIFLPPNIQSQSRFFAHARFVEMKRRLQLYADSWWMPALLYLLLLACFTITAHPQLLPTTWAANLFFFAAALAFLGLVAAAIWNLIKKRWGKGAVHILLVVGCGAATLYAILLVAFASMFGPSEDGFADNLTIPEGIDISVPDSDTVDPWTTDHAASKDELQEMVLAALAKPGSDSIEFTPRLPSLSKASTDRPKEFREYIEASPDWHVFSEQGNSFASRRWSYGGEPRNTLHGYISEFEDDLRFQTRCLLCLDRKQWSRYAVQHVMEGSEPVRPEMSIGNDSDESRVMIECGGVWLEVFEQSDAPERRVTKATVSFLEKEFAEFQQDPAAAMANARNRSRELAGRLAGEESHPFQLITGMQPGIYQVAYLLNPGEPGDLYLKAFEVTNETPLSVNSLEEKSKTRMTWSADPAEKFGAKAGFTIYEGDWGKPYAARFEVWFQPDSGKPARKLAERVFKIEGWQR